MRIGMPHWIFRGVSTPVGVCCLMSLPPLLNSALLLLQVKAAVNGFLELKTTTYSPGNYVDNFAWIITVKLGMGI